MALARDSGSGVLFYDVPRFAIGIADAASALRHCQIGNHSLQTLDAYCRTSSITRIDLLKLDVEGHELEVLEGSAEMLSRHAIRNLIFEFGGCHIDSRVFFSDLYEFLTSKGMHVSRLMPQGTFLPIHQYDESLERFRTTNYWATCGHPR